MANEPVNVAQITLAHGAKWPFDAPDTWWQDDGENPPPPTDWAHAAARGVLSDLNDRRGIKQGFLGLDEDIRAEIVSSLAAIIRVAAEQQGIASE
ncbi:hypothetical protein [Sphingopyxis sp. GW247-27LB]|uniref:hypothetical protein n=1 Tax=Sphingopyxis sp. GW247-27LB TaxID=2012632 RepID=UPI000BA5779F|nr:hypothetical protein [Sphingopyxis sp. GW247-27LB]PAL20200.1 hypothetical protein CD928_17480 [Sphingopyxis sp. GW247-27LB]